MKPIKGVCSVCACIQSEACDEGCGWANKGMTLCTACVDLSDAEREAKRQLNMADLAMRLEALKDEALELKTRMAVLEGPTPKTGKSKMRAAKQQPVYPREERR